jgi:hypothetical protein
MISIVNLERFYAVAASENAAARDEAIGRARELEKKLKAAEDARAIAESKLQELRTQTAEREESLTSRLNSMVEDLTGKHRLLDLPFDYLFCS